MKTTKMNTQKHASHLTRTRAMLAAPILLAVVALGCGEQKQQAAAETSDPPTAEGTRTGLAQATPTAAVASAVGTPTGDTGKQGNGETANDALPPDVVATVPDTLAIPGSVVVITALGSTDVTSVILTDGTGTKTPFVYDSESNLWRVSYRVPVRYLGERLGLSVTASTEANRWKRVWVFLRMRAEEGDGC